jgi:hypothetical protein
MIGEGITVPTRGGAQAFIDAADIASVAVETLVNPDAHAGALPATFQDFSRRNAAVWALRVVQ